MKKLLAILLAIALLAALCALTACEVKAPETNTETETAASAAEKTEAAAEAKTETPAAEPETKTETEPEAAPETEQVDPEDPNVVAVDDEPYLIGRWESNSAISGMKFVYTFNEDGTGSFDADGTVKNFSYTVDGSKLFLLFEGGAELREVEFTLEYGILSVRDSVNGDLDFERIY